MSQSITNQIAYKDSDRQNFISADSLTEGHIIKQLEAA